MAITKETITDKIEIVGEYKHLQVRKAIIIKEDDSEISRTAHRVAYAPGSINEISGDYEDTDLSSEDSEVQAVANTVWTDSVKTAWENKIKS